MGVTIEIPAKPNKEKPASPTARPTILFRYVEFFMGELKTDETLFVNPGRRGSPPWMTKGASIPAPRAGTRQGQV